MHSLYFVNNYLKTVIKSIPTSTGNKRYECRKSKTISNLINGLPMEESIFLRDRRSLTQVGGPLRKNKDM